MAVVAQLAEHLVVIQEVTGSIPVHRPTLAPPCAMRHEITHAGVHGLFHAPRPFVRTAAAGPAMTELLGFDEVVDEIRQRHGVRLQLHDTGSGHLVLEGRMKSGQWLRISDFDSGLHPLPERTAHERSGIRIGWLLQIHPDSPGDGGPDTTTVLASAAHASGTAEKLAGLVELVLSGVTGNAHHSVAADGSVTTAHGVRIC